MSAKPIVWSLSKWADWNQCPAMFHAKHIAKTWVDLPSPQMDRGRQIHTAMEEGVKYDIPFAPFDELAAWEPVRAALVELKVNGATVIPEHKVGMDRYYHACDFFRGENLWVRAALDVFADTGETIRVADWKTGKAKTEHRAEAMFYGSLVQHIHQKPTFVDYYYIDNPEASFSVPVGNGFQHLSAWMKKFCTAEAAIAANSFDMTPGMQCRWCGNASCPENRNEKIK